MRLLIVTRRIGVLLLLVFNLASVVASQAGKSRSVSRDKSVQCANMIVEFGNVTTSSFRGKIEWPLESPILVEIYKIKKNEQNSPVYDLVKNRTLYTALETNDKGEFYRPGLPYGYYAVRFGATEGGWNCSYLKIKMLKNASDVRIKARLDIGI